MKTAVFLLLCLIFFNCGFLPNSSGKFILVEMDQKKDSIAKSGTGNIYLNINNHLKKYIHVNLWFFHFCNYRFKLGLRESENCLKEEGIPDVCLNSFKTGQGWDGCNRWLETNHATIDKSQARLKKCRNETNSHL